MFLLFLLEFRLFFVEMPMNLSVILLLESGLRLELDLKEI
jgi:hypothetical protein